MEQIQNSKPTTPAPAALEEVEEVKHPEFPSQSPIGDTKRLQAVSRKESASRLTPIGSAKRKDLFASNKALPTQAKERINIHKRATYGQNVQNSDISEVFKPQLSAATQFRQVPSSGNSENRRDLSARAKPTGVEDKTGRQSSTQLLPKETSITPRDDDDMISMLTKLQNDASLAMLTEPGDINQRLRDSIERVRKALGEHSSPLDQKKLISTISSEEELLQRNLLMPLLSSLRTSPRQNKAAMKATVNLTFQKPGPQAQRQVGSTRSLIAKGQAQQTIKAREQIRVRTQIPHGSSKQNLEESLMAASRSVDGNSSMMLSSSKVKLVNRNNKNATDDDNGADADADVQRKESQETSFSPTGGKRASEADPNTLEFITQAIKRRHYEERMQKEMPDVNRYLTNQQIMSQLSRGLKTSKFEKQLLMSHLAATSKQNITKKEALAYNDNISLKHDSSFTGAEVQGKKKISTKTNERQNLFQLLNNNASSPSSKVKEKGISKIINSNQQSFEQSSSTIPKQLEGQQPFYETFESTIQLEPTLYEGAGLLHGASNQINPQQQQQQQTSKNTEAPIQINLLLHGQQPQQQSDQEITSSQKLVTKETTASAIGGGNIAHHKVEEQVLLQGIRRGPVSKQSLSQLPPIATFAPNETQQKQLLQEKALIDIYRQKGQMMPLNVTKSTATQHQQYHQQKQLQASIKGFPTKHHLKVFNTTSANSVGTLTSSRSKESGRKGHRTDGRTKNGGKQEGTGTDSKGDNDMRSFIRSQLDIAMHQLNYQKPKQPLPIVKSSSTVPRMEEDGLIDNRMNYPSVSLLDSESLEFGIQDHHALMHSHQNATAVVFSKMGSTSKINVNPRQNHYSSFTNQQLKKNFTRKANKQQQQLFKGVQRQPQKPNSLISTLFQQQQHQQHFGQTQTRSLFTHSRLSDDNTSSSAQLLIDGSSQKLARPTPPQVRTLNASPLRVGSLEHPNLRNDYFQMASKIKTVALQPEVTSGGQPRSGQRSERSSHPSVGSQEGSSNVPPKSLWHAKDLKVNDQVEESTKVGKKLATSKGLKQLRKFAKGTDQAAAISQVMIEMKKKGQAKSGSRLMKTFDRLNHTVKQSGLLHQGSAQLPLGQDDTYATIKPKITFKGKSLKNTEVVQYDGRVSVLSDNTATAAWSKKSSILVLPRVEAEEQPDGGEVGDPAAPQVLVDQHHLPMGSTKSPKVQIDHRPSRQEDKIDEKNEYYSNLMTLPNQGSSQTISAAKTMKDLKSWNLLGGVQQKKHLNSRKQNRAPSAKSKKGLKKQQDGHKIDTRKLNTLKISGDQVKFEEKQQTANFPAIQNGGVSLKKDIAFDGRKEEPQTATLRPTLSKTQNHNREESCETLIGGDDSHVKPTTSQPIISLNKESYMLTEPEHQHTLRRQTSENTISQLKDVPSNPEFILNNPRSSVQQSIGSEQLCSWQIMKPRGSDLFNQELVQLPQHNQVSTLKKQAKMNQVDGSGGTRMQKSKNLNLSSFSKSRFSTSSQQDQAPAKTMDQLFSKTRLKHFTLTNTGSVMNNGGVWSHHDEPEINGERFKPQPRIDLDSKDCLYEQQNKTRENMTQVRVIFRKRRGGAVNKSADSASWDSDRSPKRSQRSRSISKVQIILQNNKKPKKKSSENKRAKTNKNQAKGPQMNNIVQQSITGLKRKDFATSKSSLSRKPSSIDDNFVITSFVGSNTAPKMGEWQHQSPKLSSVLQQAQPHQLQGSSPFRSNSQQQTELLNKSGSIATWFNKRDSQKLSGGQPYAPTSLKPLRVTSITANKF